jgi:hypothetical protein
MTNNKTNQVPKLNPKGLVKMQLMMMAADLVNSLDEKKDYYNKALGRKKYAEFIKTLGEILNKEGEADWSFLEKGFRVIRNTKDKMGENTLEEVKEEKVEFLFGDYDGEIILIFSHDGQDFDVESIEVTPTTKEGLSNMIATHTNGVKTTLSVKIPDDIINKLAGLKVPIMSLNSADNSITNVNIIRIDVC